MRTNADAVVVGRVVTLLPFAAKHIVTHHEWMQSIGNRLDRSDRAPTFQQCQEQHAAWLADPKRCVFLVAATDVLCDGATTERAALLGACHLIIARDHVAEVQMVITDNTVRRKAVISESLLLLLKYGIDALGCKVFVYHLADASETDEDNRLVFQSRPDKGKAAKDERSPSLARRLSESVKKAFTRKKTDYLARLTRHLLGKDEGEHWPSELDFELIGPTTLELTANQLTIEALQRTTAHSVNQCYRSLSGDETLRLSTNTRLDGKRLMLVPYAARFVETVAGWMQQPDMYTAFGVQPPQYEDEKNAQQWMWTDRSCYAFVVCKRVAGGKGKDGAQPMGRCQVTVRSGVCEIHIGLVEADLARRTELQRETLLMSLYFCLNTFPLRRVTMPSATAVRPTVDGTIWVKELEFVDFEEAKSFVLAVTDETVVAANELASGYRLLAYDEAALAFTEETES